MAQSERRTDQHPPTRVSRAEPVPELHPRLISNEPSTGAEPAGYIKTANRPPGLGVEGSPHVGSSAVMRKCVMRPV